MAEENKRRGAPDAATRKKNRLARLEKEVEEALLQGKETAAANYLEYVRVLDEAARGTLKGITPTNQISSAKVMKEFVEKMLEEEAKAQEESESKTEEASKAENKPTPLISLVAKEA